MKTKMDLDTKDMEILIKIQKMCNETCCSNCMFNNKDLGCLLSYIKDTIVEVTEMDRKTLNRLLNTALEASEDTDD